MSYAIFAVAGYLLAFWYLYVLVMGFYRAHLDKQLTGIKFVLALPALILGYAVDLLTNWTIATVVFAEFPRTGGELVTTRLSRYMNGPDCVHKKWAYAICNSLLDSFDPTGKHCK